MSKEMSISTGDYKCPKCIVYPALRRVPDDGLDLLQELKNQATLQPSITFEGLVTLDETVLPENIPVSASFSTMETEEAGDQHTCEICMFKFLDKDSLNKHMESSHDDIRGNKRSRHETSLVFDPTLCHICEQLKTENSRLKEQLNMSQLAYNETKERLATSDADNNTKVEKLQEELNKTKDIATKLKTIEGELTISKEELEGSKDKLNKS